MTRGEYRVGVHFNPSGDNQVDRIKQCAAELIDAIDEIEGGLLKRGVAENEVFRLKALAMTAAEEAGMWGVKAATKPEPEGPGVVPEWLR